MPDFPLSDKKLDELEADFCRGMLGDQDIGALFQACKTQREVLRYLFSLWKQEPYTLAYFSHPVRRHTLDEMRRRVAMEDA